MGPTTELEVAPIPRLVLLTVLAVIGVATVVGVLVLWPDRGELDRITGEVSFAAPGVSFPDADVVSVLEPCTGGKEDASCGSIVVRVAEGAGAGDKVTVGVPPQVLQTDLSAGDPVKLQRTPVEGGDASYAYFGTVRTQPLLVLSLVFATLVIAVARLRGLFALIGLGFSGLVLWQFVLPALLVGESGLLVGLVGSAAIMFVVLYTTHGFSMRTSTALAGTLAGVLVTAGLGVVAAGATRVTGIGDDTAGILSTLAGDLSFTGLFACAIVIAGLGVLNDVTITQASAVWEVRTAAPTMSRTEVFASGMRVGRDHIASTIYTIVFAYAGTSLALLLVLQLYGLPFDVLLSTEDITQEIVRTLASSIGLVLAVPLTTGIAALVVPAPQG